MAITFEEKIASGSVEALTDDDEIKGGYKVVQSYSDLELLKNIQFYGSKTPTPLQIQLKNGRGVLTNGTPVYVASEKALYRWDSTAGADGKGDFVKEEGGGDGKSAYEIWLEQAGNEGKTEQDFLQSLKGKNGVGIKEIIFQGFSEIENGNGYLIIFDDDDPASTPPKYHREPFVAPKGDTGAKIVNTEFVGTDNDGGAVYKQTFDNGHTATFTAPKGDKGDRGSNNIVTVDLPSMLENQDVELFTELSRRFRDGEITVNVKDYELSGSLSQVQYIDEDNIIWYSILANTSIDVETCGLEYASIVMIAIQKVDGMLVIGMNDYGIDNVISRTEVEEYVCNLPDNVIFTEGKKKQWRDMIGAAPDGGNPTITATVYVPNTTQWFRLQNITEDLTVDWGDGTYSTFATNGMHSHQYKETGYYTIKIYGASNISANMFYGWASLTRVEIAEPIANIGSSAFSECLTLSVLKLPKSVKIISPYVFSNCNAIKVYYDGTAKEWDNVSVGTGNEKIEGKVYFNYAEPTDTYIPPSPYNAVTFTLNLIGRHVPYTVKFNGWITHQRVDWGDGTVTTNTGGSHTYTKQGVYEIKSIGFSYGSSNSVFAPASETDNVFCGGAITSIKVGAGIRSIPSGAFSQCSDLREVILPDGFTYIGDSAFYHCGSLQAINLPNSLDTIGARAFEGTSITDISIPRFAEVGEYAFNGCFALDFIELKGDDTSMFDENALSGIDNLMKVIVPMDCLETYKLKFVGIADKFDAYVLASELDSYVKDTDYATKSKAGVVFAKDGDYGIGHNESAGLYIAQATYGNIDTKRSPYSPITPNNLDYAVKVSITTNTQILTNAEKENVRRWLGVGMELGATSIRTIEDGRIIGELDNGFYKVMYIVKADNVHYFVDRKIELGVYDHRFGENKASTLMETPLEAAGSFARFQLSSEDGKICLTEYAYKTADKTTIYGGELFCRKIGL